MMVSPLSSTGRTDIEKAEAIQPEEQSSCCPWTRRTWRKVVIGSTVATNLSAMAIVIYGIVANNHLIVGIGAGSGVVFSTIGLFAHVLTAGCKDP